MSKNFNDVVLYTRNGISFPAIVLASRSVTEKVQVPNAAPGVTTEVTTERLTLLYADPVAGPSMVQAGKPAAAAATAFDVRPLAVGMIHGWTDEQLSDEHEDAIQAHKDAVAAVNAVPEVQDATQVVTDAHKAQSAQVDESGAPIDKTTASKMFYLDNYPIPIEPDHLLMLADRSNVKAKDIKAGDKLWLPMGVLTVQEVGTLEASSDSFIHTDGYKAPVQIPAESAVPANDQFKVGDVVRFTPDSGNDQSRTFTVNGGEMSGDPPMWFWRLDELPGSVFLGTSLELALPKEPAIESASEGTAQAS